MTDKEKKKIARMMVKPHALVSREVTEADLPRVLRDIDLMMGAFAQENCLALAHPQVEDRDPLRFYVRCDGEVFINPYIEWRGPGEVESREGCMTFPGRPETVKRRADRVVVSYRTLEFGRLSDWRRASLGSLNARVAQHEIDHLDGIYCYEH
jgi:peptide deformylase